MELVGIILSIIALLFSLYAYWQLNHQTGRVKMTRPNLVCFIGENGNDEPKIVIRGLLTLQHQKGVMFRIFTLK